MYHGFKSDILAATFQKHLANTNKCKAFSFSFSLVLHTWVAEELTRGYTKEYGCEL
jgi:hypothetical protein